MAILRASKAQAQREKKMQEEYEIGVALSKKMSEERKEHKKLTDQNKAALAQAMKNNGDEEEKTDEQLLAELEAENHDHALERRPSQTCQFCMGFIAPGDAEMLIQSTDCFHIVHMKCFKEHAYKALLTGDNMECPNCHAIVQRVEMRSVMLEEELEKIKEEQMKVFIDSVGDSIRLVKCPSEECGNMMEVSKGRVDYNVKDDKGQVITPLACEHMAEYRVRCRGCEQNFCSKCNVMPYHVGFNCEQYKTFKESTKCRYCGGIIDEE